MANILAKEALNQAQEQFVWDTVCSLMGSDDKNPIDVINQDYGGDKSRYLLAMADWHGIKFCSICGKPKQGNSCCDDTVEYRI